MPEYLRPSKLLKHLFCIVASSLITVAVYSQQRTRPPYTLLWRISGKDLKQPSYLFGTMHVKDKRVFNFSDSVMLAIQKCNSFALEVHPDTITKKLFELLQKPDTARDLRKLLNKQEYSELNKKFEEKNGYKMRGDMNPLLAEMMLKREKNKPDDEESFIDAHLYGVARTMNKNIYGLEDVSTQFKLLLGSPDDMKERLLNLLEPGGEDDSEQMIQIYSTGDLDNVLNYMKRFKLGDSVLTDRNRVMVSSMIRLMGQGSLFAAVGAAHLPGDDGVISLLKKQGYTVVAVPASFTGVAAKYSVNYDNMKWVTHKDDDLGYSVDFPSEPLKTNIYAGETTWMYPDLANENFYGIYVFPKGTKSDPANREKIINNILSNLAKKKEQVISKKNTMVNGLLCTAITVKMSQGYQRMELFVNNNILYYLYMGNHLKSLRTAYANRFFNSFKAFNVAQKPAKDWINFKNDTAALSLQLPLQPRRITQFVPNGDKAGPPYKINMFLATDTGTLMNYLVRYNDYPLGTFVSNKENILNSLKNEFKEKAKVIGEPKVIWKDGYEGREINLIFTGGYHSIIRVYMRGNRLYLLLKQNLHEGKEVSIDDDPFFSSFAFEQFIKPTFINYAPEKSNYSIQLVSAPTITRDSSNDFSSYLKKWVVYGTTSPTSGGVYSLEHTTIGKYYRAKDIDSLYKTLTKIMVKSADTLLKEDTVTINGIKGREIILENTNTKDQRRKRVLVSNNNVFFMESHVAAGQLFSEEANTYYNSLDIKDQNANNDVFSSKAGKIMDGLSSSDTSEYNEALGALGYYNFTPGELPVIYSALEKKYADDTLENGARYKLISKLRAVNDTLTISHLQTIYKNMDGNDLLKSNILKTIPLIDPKKGYDVYFNLLTGSTPLKLVNNNDAFQPLYDSLGYAVVHFQKIVPFISSPEYREDVLFLAKDLALDDNVAYNKLVKDNFGQLTRYAFDDLNTFLSNKDTTKTERSANSFKYLSLMGAIKGQSITNSYTNYYLTHNPKGWYISNATVARINNNLPVNSSLTLSLLDSIDSRYEIMEAYYNQKKFDKVPLKYKKQSEFGRLCLYKYLAADDYGLPDKLILLGSVTDKGLVYYAYKFNMPEKDESEVYIGIAGPYKPGSTRLNFKKYNAFTNYDVKSTNWVKQAKALIVDLKNNYGY